MSDNLPPELWSEILVRLSVRSLLTLKCVSKTLFSLIQNPNFASQHLTRHHPYHDPNVSNLLLLENNPNPHSSEKHFVAHRTDTFAKTMQLSGPLEISLDYEIAGYCNGLLWMRIPRNGLFYVANNVKHVLLNISIMKCLTIPLSPVSHLFCLSVGFGYDPLSNDYKAVEMLCDDVGKSHVEVYVYQLSTNCWRTIGVNIIEPYLTLMTSKVYYKGAIHCIAYGINGLSQIAKFDLGAEEFSYIELPIDDMYNPQYLQGRHLLVYNGELAVFDVSYDRACLWSMQHNGWTRLHAVQPTPEFRQLSPEFRQLSYFNEQELISIITNVLCSKNGELVFNVGPRVLSYNLESQQVKTVIDNAILVDTCVDSLLWSGLFPPHCKERKVDRLTFSEEIR